MELERETCHKRLASLGERAFLVVQDSTSFNFAHHPQTTGLGVLDDNRSPGFFAHSSLAVSLEGVPLGILDQQVWQRAVSQGRKVNAHQALPITEKESFKWLKGLQNSLPTDQTWELIMVCDREGDVYELFQLAHQQSAKFIIRAAKNRRLEDGNLLLKAVAALPPVGEIEVEIASRRNLANRSARLELRYAPFTLLPPKNRTPNNRSFPLSSLPITVIEASEQQPPQDTEAVHWLLVTNLAVPDIEAACQMLRYYSYRWLVERFHFVLKSGCQFESSQLQSFEALSRFLGVCSGVAWRLLWMTYQARKTPDASCETVLTLSEWHALAAYMQHSPQPPQQVPSLRQAMRWIGQLGGFIGRKSDGEPGVKVLWRGWEVFQTIHAAWLVFHPPDPPLDVGNA
jgi:hypothetical protein